MLPHRASVECFATAADFFIAFLVFDVLLRLMCSLYCCTIAAAAATCASLKAVAEKPLLPAGSPLVLVFA
jgi:hypothetical protein